MITCMAIVGLTFEMLMTDTSVVSNVTLCLCLVLHAACQVRCVDKATGEMMVRYTMAAQSALDLLRQLLHTCSRAAPEPDVHAQGMHS